MNASSTWFCSAQSATATLVNSGPLSNRIRCARPLVSASRSSTLMTLLLPEIEIDLDCQHLASVVVDHVKGAKPTSVTQCIAHEIRRPALVRTDGNRQWLRMPRRNTPLILSTLVQLHLAVNTVHTLVVPTVPVGFEQIVELPKSEIGDGLWRDCPELRSTPRRPFVAASTDTPVSISTPLHTHASH